MPLQRPMNLSEILLVKPSNLVGHMILEVIVPQPPLDSNSILIIQTVVIQHDTNTYTSFQLHYDHAWVQKIQHALHFDPSGHDFRRRGGPCHRSERKGKTYDESGYPGLAGWIFLRCFGLPRHVQTLQMARLHAACNLPGLSWYSRASSISSGTVLGPGIIKPCTEATKGLRLEDLLGSCLTIPAASPCASTGKADVD